jgi:TRAP-type mannitol/chloroaromatic compound transport system permease small subunit
LHFLETVAGVVDKINDHIGRGVAWLALIMVLVQFAVVVMRYVFGISYLMVQESIVYMHGLIFLIASGYTLLHNEHVRIDIFYGNVSQKRKALIDFMGVFTILLPVCALIWITAWPYISLSWRVLEGSPEMSGIPAVFLLKSTILAAVTLLALQGISLAVRSLFTMMGIEPRQTPENESEQEPS